MPRRTSRFFAGLAPLALAAVPAFVAGCAVEPTNHGSVRTQRARITATDDSYVTLRRDLRKCASPMCGGYFLHEVNGTDPDVYVWGLDFSSSGLDDANVAKAQSAPNGELVLLGHLGASIRGIPSLAVTSAFRGMPGATWGEADSFYQAVENDPPIVCITFPCYNGTATLLNDGTESPLSGYSTSRAGGAAIDRAWLTARVKYGNAIVAGAILAGPAGPAGDEQTLEAAQVFVQLPEAPPCPAPTDSACGPGTVATYKRDTDRCLQLDMCLAPRICPFFVIGCPRGYVATRWRAAPRTCLYTVCDPEWSVN